MGSRMYHGRTPPTSKAFSLSFANLVTICNLIICIGRFHFFKGILIWVNCLKYLKCLVLQQNSHGL